MLATDDAAGELGGRAAARANESLEIDVLNREAGRLPEFMLGASIVGPGGLAGLPGLPGPLTRPRALRIATSDSKLAGRVGVCSESSFCWVVSVAIGLLSVEGWLEDESVPPVPFFTPLLPDPPLLSPRWFSALAKLSLAD